MSDIQTTVVGNVVTDVRFTTTRTGGLAAASFRMASTPRRYDRDAGAWVDGETVFLTVNCWRALAEHVASSLGKGDPVLATGRLRVRAWEKEERRGSSLELDANAVGHDLSRGTSAFRRMVRTTGTEGSEHVLLAFDQPGGGPVVSGAETNAVITVTDSGAPGTGPSWALPGFPDGARTTGDDRAGPGEAAA